LVVIDSHSLDLPFAPPVDVPVDERAARRTLRAQIARLERVLGEAVFAAFPHLTVGGDPTAERGSALFPHLTVGGDPTAERGSALFPHVRDADVAPPARGRGPRMLGLGELERVRDDLAERVRRARVVVAERAELEAESRALLEEMLRDPAGYRHVYLPLSDLGEPGCGAYQVKPRLGLIGMLAGWWHVKVSSGCPRPGPA
jgi:hypothetical protein